MSPDPGACAKAAEPARFRVLLIGIDRYQDIPLKGCVNDINALEQFLYRELQLPASAITKLSAPLLPQPQDPAQLPTKARITAELRALAAAPEVGRQQVLIYYSGHGTQRYFAAAEANYEALVPVDYDRDPASLLFDFELAPLLHAIAQRCQDLTVILDCCNSAGFLAFTADSDVASLRRSRFLVSGDHPDAPLPPLPVGAEPGGLRSAEELYSRYTILAAAQSNEPAEELDGADGNARGALSVALLELLATTFSHRLGDLRWAELWPPLRVQLQKLGTAQHPSLIGSLGRKVLGGGAAQFDHGLPVQPRQDGSYALGGGELAGLGPGATVAVYELLTPATFAPLGSAADLAARCGVLVVETADPRAAIARPLAGTTLQLPGSGRGRLLAYGTAAQLRVRCTDACADWVRPALQQPAPTVLGLPETAEAAADASPEVWVGQDAQGALLIGDLVYSSEQKVAPGPLATIAVPTELPEPQRRPWMVQALRAALGHYSQYVIPLRLWHLASRPDSPLPAAALELLAIDASDPAVVSAMVQDAHRIRQLRRNERGRLPIPANQPVCFRIHNNSWFPLFVTLVLADGQGRLQLLAPPQQVAPSTGCFVWPDGMQAGVPFRFALTRKAGSIERVFAIATDSAETDFRWLAQSCTLQEAIAWDTQPRSFDGEPAVPEPPLAFTVCCLELEVGGSGVG